ncbi:hypothetical protein GQ457_11G020680 [Hibiscus cannabinus]
MIQNLKEIYERQALQERYETSKALFECKMSEGSPVGVHVIKMMGYIQTLEKLGFALNDELAIDVVLQSLPDSFNQFVLNFNLNEINKTLPQLLGMLRTAEGNMKKDGSKAVLMVREAKEKGKKLRTKNPGSTIKMAVNRVSDISSPHFKRSYVCFDALKRGWKEGCKPIMGLDGCFLKGPFKGVLLGAVGRDGNDQMYPIAWIVTEGESTDSWSWFLILVSTDLGMKDGFGYTIISDQHKDLEVAINDILPRVEHRNCARHARKKWTKAFQGLHATSDIVDNNMCEAFIYSIIEARYKSIITMLEEIRVKIMTRIVEKRQFISTWKYNYGILIKKKFDVIKKDNVSWRMVWNREGGCEVKKGRKQYLVNLNEKTCSCRRWQLCGIPCQHACCAIWHTDGVSDDYLHSCYLKDTYIKAYSYALQPKNGFHDWKKSGIEAVLPPIEREMPGRPKKNRRKAKDEPKN